MEKTVKSRFKALRWRLSLTYIGVMLAILGTAGLVAYKQFSSSLYEQLEERLSHLAQAASHNLKDIENNPKAVDDPPYRKIDQDGDLDIPWKSLRLPSQTVEWFNSQGKLLGTSGSLSSNLPLKLGFREEKTNQSFTISIAVYGTSPRESILEGYIRVSESTANLEASLAELRSGLTIGGITALVLVALGVIWLTEQSLKPIEDSYQQLKQFTADASHELRSPLTVIKTSVEVMQSHPERIHPADLDKLKGIISATNQMSQLVEDLLLLARNDGLKTTTPQEQTLIPLQDLLEDLVEFLEFKAEAKQISVTTQGFTDVLVRGNSHQLSRLFSNLLNNALQYTPPEGKVTLSMKEDELSLTVSVEDTGIGIAPEQLPFVFNRLWRADQARSSRGEGSGLGLAIAKAIAQSHGGNITVTSQLGLGSCFQVFLPKAKEKTLSTFPTPLPLISKLLNQDAKS